jgi:hypothetical protein
VSTNDPCVNEMSGSAPIVIEVVLVPGGELLGSMRRPGDTRSVSFRGWIDFMAALSDFLRDPD